MALGVWTLGVGAIGMVGVGCGVSSLEDQGSVIDTARFSLDGEQFDITSVVDPETFDPEDFTYAVGMVDDANITDWRRWISIRLDDKRRIYIVANGDETGTVDLQRSFMPRTGAYWIGLIEDQPDGEKITYQGTGSLRLDENGGANSRLVGSADSPIQLTNNCDEVRVLDGLAFDVTLVTSETGGLGDSLRLADAGLDVRQLDAESFFEFADGTPYVDLLPTAGATTLSNGTELLTLTTIEGCAFRYSLNFDLPIDAVVGMSLTMSSIAYLIELDAQGTPGRAWFAIEGGGEVDTIPGEEPFVGLTMSTSTRFREFDFETEALIEGNDVVVTGGRVLAFIED